jgi:hypothetical protein
VATTKWRGYSLRELEGCQNVDFRLSVAGTYDSCCYGKWLPEYARLVLWVKNEQLASHSYDEKRCLPVVSVNTMSSPVSGRNLACIETPYYPR